MKSSFFVLALLTQMLITAVPAGAAPAAAPALGQGPHAYGTGGRPDVDALKTAPPEVRAKIETAQSRVVALLSSRPAGGAIPHWTPHLPTMAAAFGREVQACVEAEFKATESARTVEARRKAAKITPPKFSTLDEEIDWHLQLLGGDNVASRDYAQTRLEAIGAAAKSRVTARLAALAKEMKAEFEPPAPKPWLPPEENLAPAPGLGVAMKNAKAMMAVLVVGVMAPGVAPEDGVVESGQETLFQMLRHPDFPYWKRPKVGPSIASDMKKLVTTAIAKNLLDAKDSLAKPDIQSRLARLLIAPVPEPEALGRCLNLAAERLTSPLASSIYPARALTVCVLPSCGGYGNPFMPPTKPRSFGDALSLAESHLATLHAHNAIAGVAKPMSEQLPSLIGKLTGCLERQAAGKAGPPPFQKSSTKEGLQLANCLRDEIVPMLESIAKTIHPKYDFEFCDRQPAADFEDAFQGGLIKVPPMPL